MAREAKWVLVSPDGHEYPTSDLQLYWRLRGQGYTEREDSGSGAAAPAEQSAPPPAEPDEPAPEGEPESEPEHNTQ